MGSKNIPGRAETWMNATRLAFALSSYFVLHALAMRPRALVTDPSQFGPALPGILLGWLAESLEFVVPVVLLFGPALARHARSFFAPSACVPVCVEQGMSRFEYEQLAGSGLRFPRRARTVPAESAARGAPDSGRPPLSGRIAA
ncbi:hypothetical protein GCM10028796_17770 [Ramlibacter monticola]|uniref:Uncharacterized protein n=1 Tax=Ramlibacter monticola TaxID=1926872 RepID=A0A937CSK2_9BURK|nr:hypothetical protein [Ramlibacter monticola]MBL0390603.1 hypothetical protein [Ramlibacter monticola]